ncbi:hypothetical protein IFHNHDMJ_00613 [Synechococcus sp. CBW1107]|jgi:hypothetical protein|nr:hypothetical protein IFHNHDMJ_00613 [Synechococcus sp. CBW1107]
MIFIQTSSDGLIGMRSTCVSCRMVHALISYLRHLGLFEPVPSLILQRLYVAAGRDHPAHPRHGRYDGLTACE